MASDLQAPTPEDVPATRDRRRIWLGLLLLFVLPLFVRLVPISHGMPRNYVPDTHAVRNALGMARDRDLIPPVNRYSSYPYLLPYLLLPAYAVQFAGGVASGAWSGPQEFAQHALEHPGDVQLTARLVVALLGALTTWVVFRAARAAGLGVGAWVAAWLVATGLLHTHFSVQERPWVPMVFFQALAAWAAVGYARSGATRSLVWCGVAAGLAAATHQAGLFTFGLVGLAWLCGPGGWRGPALRRRVTALVLAVVAFALVALVLGHPYRLRYGPTPAEDVIGGPGAGGVSIGGQTMLLSFSLHTFQSLTRAFFGYDPLLFVLLALGILPALRERALRPVALFALMWAGFFLTYHNDHVRYLLPLAALGALFAGWLVERIWRRTALQPVVVAALALPLVMVLRFDHVLSRPDTRALAERLLVELPPDACVAIDRYGPAVDLDRKSLERLLELRAARGEELRAREGHRLERLMAGGDVPQGVSAVPLEELFGFETGIGGVTAVVRPELEHLGGVADVVRAQGATHLLQVKRDPIGMYWLDGLVHDRERLFVVDPRSDGDRDTWCLLPMDMRFPLTELWRVERPGPWLALYELP